MRRRRRSLSHLVVSLLLPLSLRTQQLSSSSSVFLTLGYEEDEAVNVSSVQGTEIFAYSVTGYCDSSLTMTLLANPTSPKSVALSTYLLTVTPCPGPDGVTVSRD